MARFKELPPAGRVYVAAVVGLGLAGAVLGVALRPPEAAPRTLLLIALAAIGGLIKVPLPVLGSLSLAYTFVFATLMGFGLGASIVAGMISTAASTVIDIIRRQPLSIHTVCFNIGLVGLCVPLAGATYLALGGSLGSSLDAGDFLPVAAYTLVFSALNIGLISLAIHFSGRERAVKSLSANFRWAVPGFVAGSALATLLGLLVGNQNYEWIVLAAPFAYLMHLSYRARAEQIDEQRRHSEQTAELYSAVTEALAVAVEAKDEGTEEHLRRVREYCLGIGEILELSKEEMEALRVASLLHDIGKIAVPEYVLNKPGRLTPEEVEMIKIHPEVGAAILERVPFPYPLAPIVRHHHERWDGTGYPDGLAGSDIPLGARILTAVDCFDALTTDRPYRKAIPHADALEFLSKESGSIFDPAIVKILAESIDLLNRRLAEATRLNDGSKAIRLAQPAREAAATQCRVDFASMAGRLVLQPEVADRLRLLARELATIVPFRSLVVYRFSEDRSRITADFTSGHGAERLRSVSMPVGERISGWVALHQRPYCGQSHVNPLERDGSRSDLEDQPGDPELGELRATVAAPLSTEEELIGVLALYNGPEFRYDESHAALLAEATARLAAVVFGTSPPLTDETSERDLEPALRDV